MRAVSFDDGVAVLAREPVHRRRRGLGGLDEDTRRALLERAIYLDEPDERLVRMVINGTHSYRALARMCGETPGGTFRRVRSLLRRLADPLVAALTDWPAGLKPIDREIGIRHFLRRQPVREIARELGMSRWDVYRRNAYLRGWLKATQSARVAAAAKARAATAAADD